jgi:hypothetical protein
MKITRLWRHAAFKKIIFYKSQKKIKENNFHNYKNSRFFGQKPKKLKTNKVMG